MSTRKKAPSAPRFSMAPPGMTAAITVPIRYLTDREQPRQWRRGDRVHRMGELTTWKTRAREM
jgi:hypothetical protein